MNLYSLDLKLRLRGLDVELIDPTGRQVKSDLEFSKKTQSDVVYWQAQNRLGPSGRHNRRGALVSTETDLGPPRTDVVH